MTPKRILVHTVRQARRLAILVVGTTVVLLGVLMVATPGPAIVVIPLGLAILGVEFAWARRLLAHVRERAGSYADRARRWRGGARAGAGARSELGEAAEAGAERSDLGHRTDAGAERRSEVDEESDCGFERETGGDSSGRGARSPREGSSSERPEVSGPCRGPAAPRPRA